MVFQNLPVLHGAIFEHPLDNPRGTFVDIEVSGVDVPKQTLIQSVKVGVLLHSCSFDSAKIRLFTENGGFFRLCFYQQKANTACLLFFLHELPRLYHEFPTIYCVGGGTPHYWRGFASTGFTPFLSAWFTPFFIGGGSYRQGFTPAGVYTTCLTSCHPYGVPSCRHKVP